MPSYRYLLDRPIDIEQVDELVQAARERGVGYETDLAEVKNSVSKQAEQEQSKQSDSTFVLGFLVK